MVRLSGSLILLKFSHEANDVTPILSIPSGKMTLIRFLFPKNALLEILVTISPAGLIGGIYRSLSVQVPIPLTQHVPSPFEVNSNPSE